MDALLEPWVSALGHATAVRDAGQEVLARYAEPHRRYHDRRHLAEVLEALRGLTAPGPVPVAVVLAAYGHDAVYDPRGPDNEARSAVLSATVLRRIGLSADVVDEVVRLVLLTATHDADADDAAGSLLCDADLAVLAAPDARYRQYAADVRAEYRHLDDAAFRSGRAAVLRTLAQRRHLFTTERGRRRWEAAAQRNLRGELLRLGADPPPAAGSPAPGP